MVGDGGGTVPVSVTYDVPEPPELGEGTVVSSVSVLVRITVDSSSLPLVMPLVMPLLTPVVVLPGTGTGYVGTGGVGVSPGGPGGVSMGGGGMS